MKTIVTNYVRDFRCSSPRSHALPPDADDLPVRSTKDVEVVFNSLDRKSRREDQPQRSVGERAA
jgi:hypothetical protein